jgi:hypothetical protein
MTIERHTYSMADNDKKNRQVNSNPRYTREFIEERVEVFEKNLAEAVESNRQARMGSMELLRTKRIG